MRDEKSVKETFDVRSARPASTTRTDWNGSNDGRIAVEKGRGLGGHRAGVLLQQELLFFGQLGRLGLDWTGRR